jgi:hypothetical protein
MGSQKVPGMIVFHSDERIYGNVYLIRFKVLTLEHTHTFSIDPVGSTGRRPFLEFSGIRQFHSTMSSTVATRVSLRPIFRAGNSQEPLEARTLQYGGLVITGEELLHKKRRVARRVILTRRNRSDIPVTCPATSRNLCKTCT